jgi:arylsulfatase A-like enzyme
VDALMRLPMVWRPAPSAAVAPAVVGSPVGLVDIAPTLCGIAGVDRPEWMQGQALPLSAAAPAPDRVLTEWDSELFGVDVHLRTITRDGWVCTAYRKGSVHDGTEGELYDLADDPLQRVNLWADAGSAGVRDDLLADLWDNHPPVRDPRLQLQAPV